MHMTNPTAAEAPRTVTDLSTAANAVAAARELAAAAATRGRRFPQDGEDTMAGLHFLIDLADVSDNVKARMRYSADETYRLRTGG